MVMVVVVLVLVASSGSPCQGSRWWIGAWGQGTHRGCRAPRSLVVLRPAKDLWPAAAPGGDMWYYGSLPPRTPYGTYQSWSFVRSHIEELVTLLGHTWNYTKHWSVPQELVQVEQSYNAHCHAENDPLQTTVQFQNLCTTLAISTCHEHAS